MGYCQAFSGKAALFVFWYRTAKGRTQRVIYRYWIHTSITGPRVRRGSTGAPIRILLGSYILPVKSGGPSRLRINKPPHSKLGGDLGAYCDGLGTGWLSHWSRLVVFVF